MIVLVPGAPSVQVLRFPGTLAGFAEGTRALQRLLDERQVAGQTRYDLELTFEEIGANIVRHGAPAGDVEVSASFGDGEVVLTFDDDGIPFNPLERADPEIPESLDEAKVGGLGVMLIKKLAARIEYERTPRHRNRLTIAVPAR